MFSVVINHYDSQGATAHLACSTMLSASLARLSPLVEEVIVVDASRSEDESLRQLCTRNGCTYLHGGTELTFAQAFNRGSALAKAEWLILSASDIFPNLGTLEKIEKTIRVVGPDKVGCVVPTLSYSDLPYQKASARPNGRISTTPLMTINFNAFRKPVLEAIGGVPEELTGNYNDVEMLLRLHERGLRVFRVDSPVVHYGTMTVVLGKTNTRLEQDKATFARTRPAYSADDFVWGVNILPLLDSRLARLLFRAVSVIPSRAARVSLRERLGALIPILQTVGYA